MTAYLDDLDRALAGLPAAGSDHAQVHRAAWVEPFARRFNHIAREGDQAALTAWLAARDGALVEAHRALFAYVANAEALLGVPWYGDEWIRVCSARSFIEWLATLATGDIGDLARDDYDTEEFDDGLRLRAEVEGHLDPARIPPGTPPSHWWWWAPAPPPAR